MARINPKLGDGRRCSEADRRFLPPYDDTPLIAVCYQKCTLLLSIYVKKRMFLIILCYSSIHVHLGPIGVLKRDKNSTHYYFFSIIWLLLKPTNEHRDHVQRIHSAANHSRQRRALVSIHFYSFNVHTVSRLCFCTLFLLF